MNTMQDLGSLPPAAVDAATVIPNGFCRGLLALASTRFASAGADAERLALEFSEVVL